MFGFGKKTNKDKEKEKERKSLGNAVVPPGVNVATNNNAGGNQGTMIPGDSIAKMKDLAKKTGGPAPPTVR